MKQKTITLSHCELLVVELLPKIEPDTIRIVGGMMRYHDHIGRDGITVPQGNWQLLGRLPEITEDQAVRAVDESIHSGLYAHYVKEVNPPNVYRYRSSRDSLASLLTSHDVYFENSLGEEPDSGDEFYRDALGITSNYWSDLLEWQEAQSKVWGKERTYLFIKVD